jgi:membrane protein DedA with SNARE-associated domain
MVSNLKRAEAEKMAPMVKNSLSFGISFISSFFVAFILGYYLGEYFFGFEFIGRLITALVCTIIIFYVEIILYIIKQEREDRIKPKAD